MIPRRVVAMPLIRLPSSGSFFCKYIASVPRSVIPTAHASSTRIRCCGVICSAPPNASINSADSIRAISRSGWRLGAIVPDFSSRSRSRGAISQTAA